MGASSVSVRPWTVLTGELVFEIIVQELCNCLVASGAYWVRGLSGARRPSAAFPPAVARDLRAWQRRKGVGNGGRGVCGTLEFIQEHACTVRLSAMSALGG
jgi:hypothetical protein